MDFPARRVDARLRARQQPARAPHRRRARTGDARGLLSRRAGRRPARLPGDFRRRPQNPRRERHQRGQLRILADRLRRRGAQRTAGRDRSARQGSRPGDDRARARHRHAGQRLAEILGGTPGDAVSPGRDPRPRNAGRGPDRARTDDAQRGIAQLHALRLRRFPARRSASTRCGIASSPARSGCCSRPIRRRRPRTRACSGSADRPGWT